MSDVPFPRVVEKREIDGKLVWTVEMSDGVYKYFFPSFNPDGSPDRIKGPFDSLEVSNDLQKQ